MSAPAPAKVPGSFARRDELLGIEKKVQLAWEQAKIYEIDAPTDIKSDETNKYFATFPYPYMNGVLHLGHAFTLAKVEFACRYQRLRGKTTLFPFGFHCTGMPIAACADKLKREIQTYGCPPTFPEPIEEDENTPVVEKPKGDKPEEKKMKTKAKVGKKASKEIYQWNIMKEMGVPVEDIHKFQDAKHWLSYFPPIAVTHLKQFGLMVDFRRSFITTDVNPYYDSFVRWQFETLRKRDKIAFGARLSIFSPIDDNPCADHDRATGEGAKITDYTLIKLRLCEPYPEKLITLLGTRGKGKTVYLPAATLRPETMYGQTNCWLLPEGQYGIYQMLGDDIYITSERSALNMSFQNLTATRGKPDLIGTIEGSTLLGYAVTAPLAIYEKVYILPLLTIKMNKGTGVVTSVPSDAPDDYAALMDLKNKDKLREKYGIKDEHVIPFDVQPIIMTPGLGSTPAKDLCIEQKVVSQNDREKLDAIKDICYLEGFTKGVMLVGKYKDQKVSEVKPIIKADLIAAKLADAYSEPDQRVMSRSGNECVVALVDQWYLKYGESGWQNEVKSHVQTTLQTYNPIAKRSFLDTIEWLHEWACSRSYGLGTWLPWDKKFVIESLSDSTIYMAYYAVAHFLQSDLNGVEQGIGHIKAEQMTTDVWNYIYLSDEQKEIPSDCTIPKEIMERMRSEFQFWYPMDMRASGKDLIQNHLTMSLYNHAAIWDKDHSKWPRSFYTNGHILLQKDKMSKSTGNFLTLEQAIEKYSADATRFALAAAGDGLDDANFDPDVVNAGILDLTKLLQFFSDTMGAINTYRIGDMTFMDQVFASELDECIIYAQQGYDDMKMRDALKFAHYEMIKARDAYVIAAENGPHKVLLQRYMEITSILLSPICPHVTQILWERSGHKGFVTHATWPVAENKTDPMILRKIQYLRNVATSVRLAKMEIEGAAKKKASKSKDAAPAKLEDLNTLVLSVAESYPPWQALTIERVGTIVRTVVGTETVRHRVIELCDAAKESALDNRNMVAAIREVKELSDPKILKNAMAFASSIKEDVFQRGLDALETKVPFDERDVLTQHIDFITRGLNVAHITVEQQTPEAVAKAVPGVKNSVAVPGKPCPAFSHK